VLDLGLVSIIAGSAADNCCTSNIFDSGRKCERPSDTRCLILADANNYVINGEFEGHRVGEAWTRYTSNGRNGYTVDTLHKNSGSQSIKVTNGGASQWIQLDAPPRSTITISGYSKAVGASSGLPRVEASVYYGKKTSSAFNYCLSNNFVKCSYLMLVQLLNISHFTAADGTKLWGQKATFTGGTHDWEFSEYSFTVPKAVNGISLYALYRDDPAQGTAYFDDLAVAVESPSSCNADSDCGSNEKCYNLDRGNWVGEHKCYTSNLAYGQTCAADSGVQLDFRCASGLCRSNNRCGCTSNSHCVGQSSSSCNPITNECGVSYSGGGLPSGGL